MAQLFVVGIGPGDLAHMTMEAQSAIEEAQVVVGYKTYLDLVAPLLAGKEVISSGMRGEVERCREALQIAASGRTVALVSGGDSGIYGMAGLVLELAPEFPEQPEIVIVPGVSAVQAAASVLGAPLMHDFAVVSLSDLLTPWELITKRLAAVAAADFVIALYNPRSKGRVTQLEEAREIFLQHRPAETPVGIVRHACRDGEERIVTTLGDLLNHHIDMFSIVVIGNESTYVDDKGRMVTPRGYKTAGCGLRAAGCEQSQKEDFTRSPLTDHGSRETAHRPQFTNNRSPFTAHRSRSLMLCGTGSDVGKSVLTSGICRILKRRGLRVAPFKSQNMSLNSAVTPEGGEIGRAQSVQAEACGIPPHTDMNPILLKPNSDTGSQVIVQGRPVGNMRVAEYNAYKPQAFEKVRESFDRLREQHDFIVIEGAGSIAEINLKAHDIANLKVAEMADCPAILVADIDRGGVFAQIVGTLELLTPAEKARIAGIIINKFRGDASLLTPGLDFVEQRTGVPVLGVVPYFTEFRIPEEDSVALTKRVNGERKTVNGEKQIKIGVVRLSRISNYTDFDALEREPDVVLSYVDTTAGIEGLDLLILPGSKSTTSDLFFLMERGLFQTVQKFPGRIAGICGGFQMLGKRVLDPDCVEAHISDAAGLGLLDAETTMLLEKETHQATATLAAAAQDMAPGATAEVHGYEIHMGETVVGPGSQSFATVTARSGQNVTVADGAVSPDGRVFGTYLHGIFDNDSFRTAFLNRIRREKGLPEQGVAAIAADPFELLANHLEQHLDIERLLGICGLG